jgi:hypothetical protein
MRVPLHSQQTVRDELAVHARVRARGCVHGPATCQLLRLTLPA